MYLTFRLRFSTRDGQSLSIAGDPPLPASPVPLRYVDQDFWETTIELEKRAATQPLNYSYALKNADGSGTTDWGTDRMLRPADFPCEELFVIDSWNYAGYFANAFYTEPFQKVLLAQNFTEVPAAKIPNATHTFRVKAPLLAKGQTLCLLGEGPLLGNWQTERPVLLKRTPGEHYFSVQLDLQHQHFPFAYKYGVFDVQTNSFVRFEHGDNRVLNDFIKPRRHTVVNDGFAFLPADAWHGAGVAIPVFSLRTDHSFGIGEFLDLKPFAEWGQSVGLKLIQILPINDTTATHTWTDSYPYASISAFALNPAYLNLAAVASGANKKLLADLEPKRKRLNVLDSVDYEAVMEIKLGFLKKIFPSQKKSAFMASAYKKFFEQNRQWLEPYAAFCVLRDKYGTSKFDDWPEHKIYDAKKIAVFAKGNDEIAFHYFVQFHLHLQLREATAHAHACGIIVKGDIAIGVSPFSADVWQQPELFNRDLQAGAPPDPFSAKGQNWSFPTYNWPRMAADGFAWWKHRFAQMGAYFDAFRIDHILGFFRIWSSPAHAVEGILGYFTPALPIEPEEFAARGIPFDRERYLKPFITDDVLKEIFGAESDAVRKKYLLPSANGRYALKPEFATQRQVEDAFAKLSKKERDSKIKIGLFDLISNVILFEIGGKYHFRFSMEDTSSFKDLLPDVQKKLRDLYVDYFFRRQDDFCRREAMKKLPALKRATGMLICGEDLGLVPECVPDVMRDLGLLTLEVQRMPKTIGQDFSRPANAPYLSVVTPGTHDMSTIRGWWEEHRDMTQKFFNLELRFSGDAPRTGDPWIVQAIVRQHLASPAMWSIFQLQDLLGMDATLRRPDTSAERINIPAVPNFYWRYRMHLTVEKLMESKEFNSRLRKMIRENGR